MTQLLRRRHENQRNEEFSRDEMDWMRQLRWDDNHHHRHHHHRRPISKLPAIVTKLPKKVRRRLAAPVAWVVSEAVHAFSLLMYRLRQCPENPLVSHRLRSIWVLATWEGSPWWDRTTAIGEPRTGMGRKVVGLSLSEIFQPQHLRWRSPTIFHHLTITVYMIFFTCVRFTLARCNLFSNKCTSQKNKGRRLIKGSNHSSKPWQGSRLPMRSAHHWCAPKNIRII